METIGEWNCCSKCLLCGITKLVPIEYLNGEEKDELWTECIHIGWFCPDHSPSDNCNDENCMCCK